MHKVLYNVMKHPPGIGILTIIILLALINGVRGTFGLHKYEEMKQQEIQITMGQPEPMAYHAAMPSTSVPPPPLPDS
jgi:hypothetical protein